MQQDLNWRRLSAQRVKTALTLIVLATAMTVAVQRQTGWNVLSWMRWSGSPSRKPAGPDDAVYKMLDAARSGDVSSYLNCFSEPLRAELAQTAKENSAKAFSNYLITRSAALTGVAVTLLEATNGAESKVRLEYVYRDHSEIQDLFLHREASTWKIVRVAGSNQVKALIPYGTIVTD